MKLFEYQGKALFEELGMLTPRSVLVSASDVGSCAKKLREFSEDIVVKAQVLSGGRGKAGGVVVGKKKDVKKLCLGILGKKVKGEKVKSVLVVERLKVQKEYYLSVMIDRATKGYMLIFSEEGGVDIEQLAKESPRKIKKISFKEWNDKKVKDFFSGLSGSNGIFSLAKQCFNLLIKKDGLLVEINPVIKSSGKFYAADAKIVIDENALYRQTEVVHNKEQFTALEMRARKKGLHYVELDGDIAVIGNGAGLVMATLDTLTLFGGGPANFLDVGGGTGADTMECALDIVLKKKSVKGLFINIFAGITHCDEIAEGIVHYRKKKKIKIPIVVRMTGTLEKKGKSILDKNGIHAISSMEQGAKKIVKLAGKK